jgi:hypothetical protein
MLAFHALEALSLSPQDVAVSWSIKNVCARRTIEQHVCGCVQPAPYHSFKDEVAFLQQHVGHIGGGGSAFVLGDALHGLQWHIYVASESVSRGTCMTEQSIELCMTELCPDKVPLPLSVAFHANTIAPHACP